MKRRDALWVMQMCRDRDARSEAEREAFDTAIDALKSESIFTADRPKGEWVKRKVKEHQFIQNGYVLYYCSECGVEKKIGWANGINFCPNCGADMRPTERGEEWA